MPDVGEIATDPAKDRRAVCRQLGYDDLGDWTDRPGNRNIEEEHLRPFLRDKQGYFDDLTNRALYAVTKAAGDASKSLYDRNRDVYELLRSPMSTGLLSRFR